MYFVATKLLMVHYMKNNKILLTYICWYLSTVYNIHYITLFLQLYHNNI